jgi:hypothetical protein
MYNLTNNVYECYSHIRASSSTAKKHSALPTFEEHAQLPLPLGTAEDGFQVSAAGAAANQTMQADAMECDDQIDADDLDFLLQGFVEGLAEEDLDEAFRLVCC